MFLLNFYYQLFWSDAIVLGTQHNRCTVGIIGTDKMALVAPHTHCSNPDIALDMFDHMAQMNGSIGVGQGAGHKYFSVVVFH